MTNKNIFGAPICLFVYDRPACLKRTIHSLINCNGVSETQLFIFSDAPKHSKNYQNVQEVRKLIYEIKGFSSVNIILRKNNLGLAENIKDGVTNIVNRFNRVIVLEDDIEVSKNFLIYMNKALNYYQNDNKVWHINAWSVPQSKYTLKGKSYFTSVMNCWGWATWSNRWNSFYKDPESLVKNWDDIMIKKFDLNNSGVFWPQVLKNLDGSINTWAIFWYAVIFENNGLCLSPKESLIQNFGIFEGGENFSKKQQIFNMGLKKNSEIIFPDDTSISKRAHRRIVQYYHLRNHHRLIRVLRKIQYAIGL